MAGLARERLTFRHGDEDLHGGLVRPDDGREHPGVVLVPSVHGVNPYVVEVADRLAACGYAVLALDIYSRGDSPGELNGPEQIRAAVAALPDRRVAGDVAAAGRHLGALAGVVPGQVAAMGFCVGGLYAYLAACEDECFVAAVDFYGMIRYERLTDCKPVSPIDRAADLRAPLLAHFGDLDPWCPSQDVRAFADRLAAEAKVYELYQYPGAGHAFHERHRPPVYRPVAATTAWDRSLTFLGHYLGGGSS